VNATSGNTITRTTAKWAQMSNCEMCGGRGVIRTADVYTSAGPRRESLVLWELSQTIRCGCAYKEAA
jgi:hypothetical protein